MTVCPPPFRYPLGVALFEPPDCNANRCTPFGLSSPSGMLASLKNVKKDVTEMRKGTECGMSFENWSTFAVGDLVQCYETEIEKRHL